jgi:hypothetical protein
VYQIVVSECNDKKSFSSFMPKTCILSTLQLAQNGQSEGKKKSSEATEDAAKHCLLIQK